MKFQAGSMIAIALLFVGGAAMAHGDGSSTQEGPMQGHRAHMMMAMQECVNTGKSMLDCRQEMMKNHHEMGKEECPMKSQMQEPEAAQDAG